MNVRHTSGLLALTIVGLCAGSLCARADAIILDSSVKGLEANTVLLDGAMIEVPAAAHVQILMPSGDIKQIEGPFRTSIGDLIKGQKESELFKSTLERVERDRMEKRSKASAEQASGPDVRRFFCEEVIVLYDQRACAKQCAGPCAAWVQRYKDTCQGDRTLSCGSN
jgi:hypothetical protein